MHEPVSFVLILHCISIIRRISFSSVFVNVAIVGWWLVLLLFPVDVDIESRRWYSRSLTNELDLSWCVVDDVVLVRDFIPLLIIIDGFVSLILFEWNIDESVMVWIGVVKSFSVVVDANDDRDDVDEVKFLSEIVDLVGTVRELCVGNNRW